MPYYCGYGYCRRYAAHHYVRPLSYAVTYCRLPHALANLIFGITSQPQLLMIIILVWLFILGMFLDSNVNFLLSFTPIFLPMVQKVGFDPVHFGVLMATIVTMGVFTPPVGSAIYPVCSIIKCPVDEYTKEALPFFCSNILGNADTRISAGCCRSCPTLSTVL